MAVDVLDEALASVSLKNPAFPIDLVVTRSHERTALEVRLLVPDRETGVDTRVIHSFPVPPWKLMNGRWSRADAVQWVRLCLDRAIRHEVDEWWHVDGVRVRDPHAPNYPDRVEL